MPELSQSAYVILGMLDLGVRSGYEIKQAVDESTRHFSALSFRQIYPELKQLEELGLVSSQDASAGARRRTFHALTDAGREALDAWLRADDEIVVELRHSGVLKLFFADRLDEDARAQLVARVRASHATMGARLKRSRPVAAERLERRGERLPLATLDFGIELNEFIVGWCDRLTAAVLEAA